MIEVVLSGLKYLFRPYPGESAQAYGPRAFLALLVVAAIAGELTHIALACGRIPSLFPGFATSTQIDDATVLLNRVIDRADSGQIRQDYRDNCHAMATPGADAAPSAQALSDDLDAWAAKHHAAFALQPSPLTCAAVGVPLPH